MSKNSSKACVESERKLSPLALHCLRQAILLNLFPVESDDLIDTQLTCYPTFQSEFIVSLPKKRVKIDQKPASLVNGEVYRPKMSE